MDVQTVHKNGVVDEAADGWAGRLPTVLVSRVFAFCDLQTHIRLRHCNRRLLAVAQLATSSPRYILLSVNDVYPVTAGRSAGLARVAVYKPTRLRVIFHAAFTDLHVTQLMCLPNAAHLRFLYLDTRLPVAGRSVEIGLSLRPFTHLTTFVHAATLVSRDQHLLRCSGLSIARSLTHLQVPTLASSACLDLPLTLRVLGVQCMPTDWKTPETELRWHAHLASMRHLTQLKLGLEAATETASIAPYSLADLARNSPGLVHVRVPVCVRPVEPLAFAALATLGCTFTRGVASSPTTPVRRADWLHAYHRVLGVPTLTALSSVRDALHGGPDWDIDCMCGLLPTAVTSWTGPSSLTALDVSCICARHLTLCLSTALGRALRTLRLWCDDAFAFQCLAQLSALEHLHIDSCRCADHQMTLLQNTLAHASSQTNETALRQVWPNVKSLRSLTFKGALTQSNLTYLRRHYRDVDTSRSVARRPYEAPHFGSQPPLGAFVRPDTVLCTHACCDVRHSPGIYIYSRLKPENARLAPFSVP
jgi:hypothetical protein